MRVPAAAIFAPRGWVPMSSDADANACPRCRELEERVAELERQLAEARRGPVAITALKVKEGSWCDGWGLRPSPARRHWMDGLPYSYRCLPMVVANQWGWQVLCPADVVVSWDGSPEP